MSKIKAYTVSVRIKGRCLYSFEYKTPIRGDFFIKISRDSELYDEWEKNIENPSQSRLKTIIKQAKQGTHYSKDGRIIKLSE